MFLSLSISSTKATASKQHHSHPSSPQEEPPKVAGGRGSLQEAEGRRRPGPGCQGSQVQEAVVPVRLGEPEPGGGGAAEEPGVGERQGALVQPLSGETKDPGTNLSFEIGREIVPIG